MINSRNMFHFFRKTKERSSQSIVKIETAVCYQMPTRQETARRQQLQIQVIRECFLKGAYWLTGAVGALWSAGWCLAIRAAAELCVVTGWSVLGCGHSGACHHGTWGWYTSAHNNSWSFRIHKYKPSYLRDPKESYVLKRLFSLQRRVVFLKSKPTTFVFS